MVETAGKIYRKSSLLNVAFGLAFGDLFLNK
jgi:hypothetical protein